MNELFVDYLLHTLDDPTAQKVEAYLAEHPEAQKQLALLEQALAALEADKAAPPTPPHLVERTLARVAAQICANQGKLGDLPQAPPVSRSAASGGRSWWRRADVFVAASLLVTAVGITLTVLGSMRAPSSDAIVLDCSNNLRQFFLGLEQYRVQHGHFPNVADVGPRDVAGIVVPMLAEAGVLPEMASIQCRGIGDPMGCQVSLASLRTMSEAEFDKYSPSLLRCYAYSVGYRTAEGNVRPTADWAQASFSQIPLMADRPPAEGVPKNSINHNLTGQNVLFADGHVTFLVQRTYGAGDDIFLNRNGQVGAGVDFSDIVLGYSSARP
jgi:prepilin-type processing-associated H-X9-DG protein